MYTSNRRTLLLKHIKYIVFVFIIWLCYLTSGIGCPIYKLLQIRCPTCGVTSALVGLIFGDLELYFNMNPFAAPLIVAVVVCMHLSVMSHKWRRCGMIYVLITVISNFCWYISTFI